MRVNSKDADRRVWTLHRWVLLRCGHDGLELPTEDWLFQDSVLFIFSPHIVVVDYLSCTCRFGLKEMYQSS